LISKRLVEATEPPAEISRSASSSVWAARPRYEVPLFERDSTGLKPLNLGIAYRQTAKTESLVRPF
jgi:hypothetical protein